MLACGKSVPVVSSVCVQPLAEARMPVVKGKVYTSVNVLRGTGCSGVVVKKDLVTKDQYIGEYNHMVLIDGTVRKVPVARIYVDTPYLTGIVEAQCLSHMRSTILSLVMCQVLEQQTTRVILRRLTQIKGVQRSNLNHPRMLLQIKLMHQKLVDRSTQRFVSGNICSEGLKSPEIFGFNCSESERFIRRNITSDFRNKRTY